MASAAAKPNVLFITSDQQRYDCIGANGNPRIQTPVLDALAGAGVSLERCYVQNPVCMPSRASIWTGRYPQNHRVTTNGIALPKTEVTMAHAFRQAGYHTANVGKLHFLPHKGRDHTLNHILHAGYGYETNHLSDEPGCYPDAFTRWIEQVAPEYLDAVRVPLPAVGTARRHFDEWVLQAPEQYSHTAWIARTVDSFLARYTDPRPFFLTVGFYAPHPPLNPPQRYVDLYKPDDLPLPRQHPADMEKSRHRDISPERWRRMKAFFYAMCSLVDHYVGGILDSLKATSFAENTIIVFMSDHGDALGDHGQVAKGPSNYEAIVRVPCIVRWPGVLPAGRRMAALVESIDLFPTLCDLCGIAVPSGVKGASVRGLLQGTTEHGRDDVLIEFKDPRSGLSVKTLRTDAYKYFRYHDGRETLYDLREEDEEVFNQAGDHAYHSVLQQMRERMLARLMRAEDDLPERTHDY